MVIELINKHLQILLVSSSGFKIVGDDINTYYLNDDGAGTLRLYYVKGTGEFEYIDGLWGSIDYDMGEIVINDLIIQSTAVANNTLQIKAVPKSNDLVSLRETYITLGIDNSVITVVEDTISRWFKSFWNRCNSRI